MPKLMKPESATTAPLVVDASQQRVLDSPARIKHVLGAPGTGKTTLAVEAVAQAVAAGLKPDECVLLSPTRTLAGEIRARATARIGGTSSEPIARTPQALAFGILRARAALAGLPAPRLLSGPEQDVVLKELLAGHRLGLGRVPQWPADLAEALPTRGFRNELRDLLMRTVEWGLNADQLAQLGREHGRPEWVAAASVLDEYDDVTAFSRPGAYDPAWILGGAADVLRAHPELLEQYRRDIRLIVVDDAQELTHAGLEFLRTLLGPSQRLILIGEPDVTVQGFRGADPRFFGDLAANFDDCAYFTLEAGYRQPEVLDEARRRVVARIGAVGGAAHREVARAPGGDVNAAVLRSAPQEAAHIAGVLRAAHLLDGVPWRDMAVIVRGSGGTAALRRALNAARVPVALPPATLALGEEPAVRPFLELLDVVTRPRDALSPARALDLLTSVVGGADPVALRRLRRSLRRYEVSEGGSRTSDELLVAVLVEPEILLSLGPEAASARRIAKVIAAGREALAAPGASSSGSGEEQGARTIPAEGEHGATGSSRGRRVNEAEHVLWAMWQAAGLASVWEEIALDGGVAGTRADRDLDAMLALFSAAETYVDRLPGARSQDFLEHIRGIDVPGDRLVAAAPDEEAVALLTPAAAAGRSWHTVIIAGVQDGVWPDLRLRGSVLGSEMLVDILAGRGMSLAAQQTAIRYDETRQLAMAVSRARERVLMTAVRDEDEQPSAYLDIVDPLTDPHGEAVRPFTPVARPMTLAGAVAQARRDVLHPDEQVRDEAARRLARLAYAGVPGADPAMWWTLIERSDDRPLRGPGELVRVSPSKVGTFTTCPLNWFLSGHGGSGGSQAESSLGTLIHEIAAEFPDGDLPAMREALDQRWGRLGLGENWLARLSRHQAEMMLRRYADYTQRARDEGWQFSAAEQKFSVDVDLAKISGSVDRVETHVDLGMRVVDYKTGKRAPSKAELPAHPQLTAYQVALREGAFGGSKRGSAALVQLGDGAGTKPLARIDLQAGLDQVDPGEDDEPAVGSEPWARSLIAETAKGMGANTFAAQPNSLCGNCPVRSSCPAQPEGRTL